MSGPVLTAPLVSTQWLADYLGSEKLLVLDATVLPYVQPNGRGGYLSGHEEYLISGHIPGAGFADLIDEFSDPSARLPFTHPTAEAFAAAAGAIGVDNDTTVIVYDAAVGQWASRLWWLFRTFGYDRVAVLDGGYTKWVAEGRETDLGHHEPVAATFGAVERPELWVTKADVEAIVAGKASGALVCGVPPKEFSGEAGSRARLGHIPGSISAPAVRLVDRDTNALLPEDALRAAFGPALNSERVVTYCAGGIAAASDALALTLLGHRNVAIYDGSLSEWAADESLPLVTTV
ncbi:MAG: sulfurtransferase [Glaciihabitans sp.]|jgi:thiosulfate/3-mercaptopyruvate sulfurtransferase|nr:sulfurtransferase [Glaciihabitans sp.]